MSIGQPIRCDVLWNSNATIIFITFSTFSCLLQSGEKVLMLKRKYRDGGASSQPADTTSSLLKELPRHRPKAKKAKLAEQFESTMSSDTSSANITTSGAEAADSPAATLESDVHVGPPLSEMIAGEIGSMTTQIQDTCDQQPGGDETCDDDEASSVSNPEAEPMVSGSEQGQAIASEVSLPMVEEDIVPEEPPAAAEEDGQVPGQVIDKPENGEGGIAAAAAAHHDGDTDSGMCDDGVRDGTDTDGASIVSSGVESVTSTPAPNRQTSVSI